MHITCPKNPKQSKSVSTCAKFCGHSYFKFVEQSDIVSTISAQLPEYKRKFLFLLSDPVSLQYFGTI